MKLDVSFLSDSLVVSSSEFSFIICIAIAYSLELPKVAKDWLILTKIYLGANKKALWVLSGAFGSLSIVWCFWLSGYCLMLLALWVLSGSLGIILVII